MGSRRGAACRLLLIVFIFDAVMCNIQDFLANLSTDFGNSMSNAWNNMIKAIKRPVRIRRLGRTGKRRTPRSKQTTELMFIKSVNEEMQSTYIPVTTARSAKIIIPFLATPHWKTMLDWKRHRHGLDWKNHNRLKTYRYVTYDRTQDGRITPKDDITHFGNLFFV